MVELTIALALVAVVPLAWLLNKTLFRGDRKRERWAKVGVLAWAAFLSTYYTVNGWPF